MDCSMPCQTSLSFTISQSLLKFMSVELKMPLNHLILCCPLLLLASVFPSIRVFSMESALHIKWPKYWSFSFNVCPSNEYFLKDWLVWSPCCPRNSQELLQHHSSKAPVLQHYAFFPGGSISKESACNAGDLGSIPGSGRSPGEGNSNLLWYSYLGNPTDRGAWWASVQRVKESQTRPRDQTRTAWWHMMVFIPNAKCLLFSFSIGATIN